jgi:hypothetical protein
LGAAGVLSGTEGEQDRDPDGHGVVISGGARPCKNIRRNGRSGFRRERPMYVKAGARVRL